MSENEARKPTSLGLFFDLQAVQFTQSIQCMGVVVRLGGKSSSQHADL